MKVGESLDGWTIAQIDRESIQIESNCTRQTVITNDPLAQIPRESSRTAAVAPAVPQPAAPVTPPPAAVPTEKRTRVIETPFGTTRTVVEDAPRP